MKKPIPAMKHALMRDPLSLFASESPKSSSHYLKKGNENYRKDAIEAIARLKPALRPNQLRNLVHSKLQHQKDFFSEEQFLQNACETSAASSFVVKHPVGYVYERRQSGKKDVDFSFIADEKRFNVEAKCFNHRESKQNSLIVSGPQLSSDFYKEIAARYPNHQLERSRLLSIRDFLESAKGKFLVQRQGEYNVLMISCFDLFDFIDVTNCIAGQHGISFGNNKGFREQNDGNVDIDSFKVIDAITINNLGLMHQKYHSPDTDVYMNPWNYNNAFTFGFELHLDHNSHTNNELGFLFQKTFNFYNAEYNKFCAESGLHWQSFATSMPRFIEYLQSKGGSYF